MVKLLGEMSSHRRRTIFDGENGHGCVAYGTEKITGLIAVADQYAGQAGFFDNGNDIPVRLRANGKNDDIARVVAHALAVARKGEFVVDDAIDLGVGEKPNLVVLEA